MNFIRKLVSDKVLAKKNSLSQIWPNSTQTIHVIGGAIRKNYGDASHGAIIIMLSDMAIKANVK